MIKKITELNSRQETLFYLFAKDMQQGRKFYNDLLHQAYRFTQSMYDAEDAVSEVIISMSQKTENYKGEIHRKINLHQETTIKRWIKKSLSRLLIDNLRKKLGRYNTSHREISETDFENYLSTNKDKKFSFLDTNIFEKTLTFEEIIMLYEALDLLSEEQKRAITLRYFDRLTSLEIQEHEGVCRETVSLRIRKAKGLLKKMLTND